MAELAGYTVRVGQICDFMNDCEEKKKREGDGHASSNRFGVLEDVRSEEEHRVVLLSDRSSPTLNLNHVNVVDPLGTTVVRDACLSVTSNTLITGPSGSGKTSIVRTLCGLWSGVGVDVSNVFAFGDGNVPRENVTCNDPSQFYWNEFYPCLADKSLFVVPQNTYLPFGNLIQQICYPRDWIMCQDLHDQPFLFSLLTEVGLGSLVTTNLDIFKNSDWSFLSPGQKQQLAMARVLYTKPKIVILDETTSHVDPFREEWFYTWLKKSRIRFLSIGHRSSLRKFHDHVLVIKNNALVPEENQN
eukprot:TRINITY_DN676_c0_g2_i2.p1 TRINITY_DN676_c0_g2~~TRINITY_DN676_c0_g2_i2.p1  ORF type:complete len:301 (-),score=64.81 TRINITY_DN676_c0_g2_i2:224-1126(-)